MVGRADRDRVDVVAGQELAEVAIHLAVLVAVLAVHAALDRLAAIGPDVGAAS